MSTSCTVPHVGIKGPGNLPTNLRNTGYWTKASKNNPALDIVMKYMTEQEWTELATGVNEASDLHSYEKHPCGTGLLFGTCGICFCPLLILSCELPGKVNDDIQEFPVTAALKKRGITLHWNQRIKLNPGGLTLIISPKTPPVAPWGGTHH